jgi:integrase
LPDDLAPATIRRLASDLKASLNRAIRGREDALPAGLPIVIRNGLASDEDFAPVAREAQILTDDEVRRVIAGARAIDAEGDWQGDLARMTIVLAATGARFSQLTRLSVADVQPGRILVPTSRKGRGIKQRQRIAVRVGRDVMDALRPAFDGRRSSEPLLQRWRWKQTKPTQWERDRRGPWSSASELTRPWALIRERAGLAADIVPYALRHSSIVRGLRAGLPVRLVASLHDTSSAMIERHYSAFIVDAMDELAERAVVPLTSQIEDATTFEDRHRG